MPDYIRPRDGCVFFFTVVTYDRRPILCLDDSRKALRESVKDAGEKVSFKTRSWVLLPDHLHCILEFSCADADYSALWSIIKRRFTQRIGSGLENLKPGASRIKRREGTVWQRRFWEHRIRDERDFQTHCDYIHYNPVKHGLVAAPNEWKFSTFHDYVKAGLYPADWGGCGLADLPGAGGE